MTQPLVIDLRKTPQAELKQCQTAFRLAETSRMVLQIQLEKSTQRNATLCRQRDELHDIACRMAQEIQELIDEAQQRGDNTQASQGLLDEFDRINNRIMEI